MNSEIKNMWHSGILYFLPLLPIFGAFILPEECPGPSNHTVIAWCVLASVALVAGFRLVFIERRKWRGVYLMLLAIYCFGICSHILMAFINALK